MSSPYQILGIPHNADPIEARRAFRAIAKSCHPDINPDPNAQAIFIEAEAAYREITGAVASSDRKLNTNTRLNREPEIDLPISIWTAAVGGQVKGSCPLGKASIKVPIGARQGDRILANIGGKTIACVVRILETEGFRADGGDISTILRISNSQAKSGGHADIETPIGKLRIKLPKDTPDGARLRVEGKGIPATNGRKAGDLYLDVEIVETATDRAVSALDKILNKAHRPRATGGIFGKKRA
jgi:curved DNA-binding protein